MKKIFAILILLSLITGVQAYEIEQKESFKVKNEIRNFEVTDKDNFTIMFSSQDYYYFHDRNGRLNRIPTKGDRIVHTSSKKEINGKIMFASGSRFGNSRFKIFSRNGKIILDQNFPIAADRVHFTPDGGLLVGMNSLIRKYSRDGEILFERNHRSGRPVFGDKVKGVNKFMVGGTGGGDLVSRDTKTGDLVNDYYLEETTDGFILENGDEVISWDKGIGVARNGKFLWKEEKANIRMNPEKIGDRIVYSTDNKIVFRDIKTGKKVHENSLENVGYINKHPRKDLIVGTVDRKLALIDHQGNLLEKFDTPDIERGIKFADYTGDGELEIAAGTYESVEIYDLKGETGIDQKLEETVFIGEGKEIYRAIATGQPVIHSQNLEGLQKTVERTGKKPVGVGNQFDDMPSTEDVTSDFNTEKEKYYIDSLKKAPYITKLAYEDGKQVTFEKSEATKTFEETSVKELQEEFGERFKPNHVVAADLESGKGEIAAFMAVQDDIMPVHVENGSTVAEALDKIDSGFDNMGNNLNTVTRGKYVSLLGAPLLERRMEVGTLVRKVGFNSSRPYREEGYSVGRYPENSTLASVMYLNSLKENSLETGIASSYLHNTWPVVLSTSGGGMRHGYEMEKILDREDVENTNAVERRSNPVKFLKDISYRELTKTLRRSGTMQDLISEFSSKSIAIGGKYSYLTIKTMEYTEKVMELYYEHKWETSRLNTGNVLDSLFGSLEGSEKGEEIENKVARRIYRTVWPDPKMKKNRENIINLMEDRNVFYFIGRGGNGEWLLPESPLVKPGNWYDGSKTVKPDDPESFPDVVWDATGTIEDGFLDEAVLSGTSSYVTYDNETLSEYNAYLMRRSLGPYKTVGQSVREAALMMDVKSMNGGDNPGIELTLGSLSVYGNPENRYHSLDFDSISNDRECRQGTCTVEVDFRPEKKQVGGSRIPVNGDMLLADSSPLVPLYRYDLQLTDSAKISNIEDRTVYVEEGLEPVYNRLLTHTGDFNGDTRDFDSFPEERYTVEDGELLVAGQRFSGDRSTVLEKAEFEIEYSSPVTVNLVKDSRSIHAEVYSNRDRELTMAWRINDDYRQKSVNLSEGMNSFKLETVDYGEHTVEIHLYSSEEVLVSREQKIRFKEDLKFRPSGLEVTEGEESEITLEVENPNSFSVKERVSLSTGGGLMTSIMEQNSRDLELEAGERENVSWEVVGLHEGNSTVTAGGDEFSLEVEDRDPLSQVLSVTGFSRIFDTSSTRLELRSGSRSEFKLVQGNRSLESRISPDLRYEELSTPQFRVSRRKDNGTEILEVDTQDGSGLVEKYEGDRRVEFYGGMDRETLEEKVDLLEREIGKIG